jgi:hypothetical protein
MYRKGSIGDANCFFKLGVFFLGVDEVKHDVERPREDEGEEKTKTGQISVALRA